MSEMDYTMALCYGRLGYQQQLIRELEATDKMLRQQLHKVELRLRIAISIAVGATAGFITSLLF